MRIVRVHNPSGLKPTRKRKTTMAKRKRRSTRRRNSASVGRPRKVAARTVNPRRRRRRSRRNPTTIVARSRSTRRVINPRQRRRVGRRRNPSGLRIGSIVKDAVYGAGGAILTRAGGQLVEGLIPSQFATSPLARPVVQGIIAVTAVRMIGKKFLGQRQGDVMMAGGLVSAALAAADHYLPNVQGTITNFFQPVLAAPAPQTTVAGFRDVYELPRLPGAFDPAPFGGFGTFGSLGSFGDVEELPLGGIFA